MSRDIYEAAKAVVEAYDNDKLTGDLMDALEAALTSDRGEAVIEAAVKRARLCSELHDNGCDDCVFDTAAPSCEGGYRECPFVDVLEAVRAYLEGQDE